MKPGRIITSLTLILWSVIASAQIRDEEDIVRALFLETLRADPTVLEGPHGDRGRFFALNTYVEPGISKTFRNLTTPEQQAKRDAAGAWISDRLQASSVLPLDIEVAFPASVRINDDGSLALSGSIGKKLGAISGTLEDLKISAPQQTPSIVVRPVQPFDTRSMTPDATSRPRLEELARTRQGLMTVARLTITHLSPTIPLSGMATAGGRVTSVALHELTAVDRKPVAGDPIWHLPAAPAAPQSIRLADIERVLKLGKTDGAYDDANQTGNGPLVNLLQWRALTALPVEEVLARRLSPDLFWRLYGEFAPRSLQDALIAPDKLDQSRRTFAPFVNAIDQRQIEDAVIRALWPQVSAIWPTDPLRVISTVAFPVSDYDFDRGGFAMTPRASGWLLGSRYPILAGMPEFLPASKDKATILLDRMTALDGPGRRYLTVRAVLDLSLRQAVFAPEGALGLPRVVAGFDIEAASLHAGMRHPNTGSLMRNKLLDLDPDRYRGADQPIADQAALAGWAEIAEDRGARGEDLIAAAISVAGDPAALARAMDPQSRTADPVAAAMALDLPDPPVLTGQMRFTKSGTGWGVTDFRWTYHANESGLTAPGIELADTAILTAIALSEEQDKALSGVGGRVQYRATFEPVTAALKGSKPVLYLRLTEVALFSPQKDETGLPIVRIVLKPEAAPPAPDRTAAQSTAVQAPDRVVLDHDYLDLLLMAQLGNDLDDITLDRMLLDRLHRELRTQNEADLPWGRFFDPMPQRLNRVERAGLLPDFRAWQMARAGTLPQQVVVATAASYLQAPCGVQVYAAPAQVNNFSDDTRALLEGLGYEDVAASVGATLGILEKVARDVPERQPVLAERRLTEIGGRPIYALLRTGRHPSATACTGTERLDAVTDGFDPARSGTADAVVVLHSPVLMPNERRFAVQTRHHGRVRDVALVPPMAGTQGPKVIGTLRIDLDVTDSVFYAQDALPQRHIPNPTGKPVRVSVEQVAALRVPPAKVLDIKGLTLGTSPADMQGTLTAKGPMQRNYGRGFAPDVTPKPVPGHGMHPATEIVTQADMLIDRDAGEVLLSIVDARLAGDRLGLGRLTQYDASKVTPDGVLGALLKKYGEPSHAEETRRGGRPLARYAWGFDAAISMPHCLPDLANSTGRQMRQAFAMNGDEDRAFLALAEALPWPAFGPVAEGVQDFADCQPMLVAEITQSAGQVRLVTWLLDPSRIASLTWPSEPSEPEPARLIDGAADIDL
jgi:hypothetical protein